MSLRSKGELAGLLDAVAALSGWIFREWRTMVIGNRARAQGFLIHAQRLRVEPEGFAGAVPRGAGFFK